MPKAHGSSKLSRLNALLQAGQLKPADVFNVPDRDYMRSLHNIEREYEKLPGFTSWMDPDDPPAGAQLMSVNFKDVVSDQPGLGNDVVQSIVGRNWIGWNDPPLYVKWQGKYYIENGNHRSTAAVLQGKSSIKAYVVDLDAFAERVR